MTKEEQINLTALAVKLERYAGRTEEALVQTSARLDRLDKTLETNSALLREGWQQQQQTVAGLLATCAERQQRLTAVEAAVRDLVHEVNSSGGFDPHILTPVHGVPTIPAGTGLLASSMNWGGGAPAGGNGAATPHRKPTAEVYAERSAQAWKWLRERASTLLALIALVSALGAAALWMASTYQQIERLQASVARATDGGALPR